MLTALVIAASTAFALDCPEGTKLLRLALPDGSVESSCVRGDGQPHGPSETVSAAGKPVSRGAWKDGAKHGDWRLYRETGQTWQVGRYDAGARTGPWTTLGLDGEPVATVFHGTVGAGWPAGEPVDDARLRWRTAAGEGPPQVEVASGVLLMRQGSRLSAVSPETGAVDWSLADPNGWRAGAVVAGEHVAAVTGSGLVVLADLAAGTTVGIRTELGASDVLDVDADTVWLRDGAGRIAAWDALTGEARWVAKQAIEPVAPVAAGAVLVGSRGRELYAVLGETGVKAWGARLDATVVALAVGADGESVLALTSTGTVQRFGAGDGAPGATLTPETPVAVGPGSWLREETGGVVVGTGERIRRLASGSGTVRAEVRGLGTNGDLGPELGCGGVGGLTCRRVLDGLLVDDLPPVQVAGRVKMLDGLVLVPSTDRLVAVDPVLVAATETDGELVVWLRTGPDTNPLEGLAPFELVERPGECLRTDAVVDLRGIRALLPPEHAGAVTVEIPELEIAWTDDDPEWTFAEGWEPERISGEWEASWFSWWRPELQTVVPVDGSPQAAAALDRLLACDGPGATFRGQVIAHDSKRRLVLEGSVSLDPFPHEVEGLPGCLVDLWVDGQDYGPFRPTAQPGWMDAHVTIDGVADAVEIPETGLPLPDTVEQGVVVVETLFPGELERREVALDAPVAVELVDGWPFGLDVRFVDVSSEVGLDPVMAQFPVDDLVLADVPAHTEWWAVSREMPLDAWDEAPRVVWSMTDCEGEVEEVE